MNKQKYITLGSLFDGIGGFPYAGSFFEIKPLWASEILPQAISVTRRHLPEMAHVGDIMKLDGGKLPPVDIITFGSPCQGLSTAGRRLGFADERSGLFSEAIRIINEMRCATNGRYPRYAVWENVPGALSSGTPPGSDFKAVLEAFTKTEVPVSRSGKWANAGMVRGNGVDLAWCVYNAQYFGVPQRRRRIFLVCDFGGRSAGEILFVAKSLQGYFAKSRAQGQGFTADALRGADGTMPAKNACNCLNPWEMQQLRIFTKDGTSPTLAGADGGGGRNPGGLVFAAFMGDSSQSSYGIEYMEEGSPTIKPRLSGTPCVCEPKVAAFVGSAGAKARSIGYSEKLSPTLKGEPCGFNAPCVCEPNIARTLMARGDSSPCVDRGQNIVAVSVHQNQSGDVNTSETAYTLATNGNATGRNAPLVAHPAISGTLMASGAGLSRPAGMASETDLCVVVPDAEPIPIQDKATRYAGGGNERRDDGAGNGLGIGKSGDPSPTITTGDRHAVAAYCLQGNMIGREDNNGPRGNGVNEEVSFTLNTVDQHSIAAVDCRNYRETEETSGTLQAKTTPGYSLNYQNPIRAGYIVRRLLPVECERLQGYPDGWTEFGHDGKQISDTRRYQMLGNSVAVPCVAYILMGIAEQFRKEDDI